MTLAEKMLAAFETADNDMGMIVDIRSHFLDTHVKRHYSEEKFEMFFFNDGSLLHAERTGDCKADCTCVPKEIVPEYLFKKLNR